MQKPLMSQERSHPLVAHWVCVPVNVQEAAMLVIDGAVVVVSALQGLAETVLLKIVSTLWQMTRRQKEGIHTSTPSGEWQAGPSW